MNLILVKQVIIIEEMISIPCITKEKRDSCFTGVEKERYSQIKLCCVFIYISGWVIVKALCHSLVGEIFPLLMAYKVMVCFRIKCVLEWIFF
jgi:hypothetical protein